MTFYLPDKGNSITPLDIDKGILRITVNFKSHFPAKDSSLKIVINNKEYKVKYTKRIGRSDLLNLGKKLLASLIVDKNCKLKFTKLSDDKFRIDNEYFLFTNLETDDINYLQLKKLKKKYWDSLKSSSFPKPPSDGSSVAMIKYFKRKNIAEYNQIGPYFGLTVFEAANRIASDLVIINGILQLIENKKEPKNSKITIRLGNKHVPGKGDFSINGKEGEAFNVAASFYKVKLRNTNTKWIKGELSYILVNAEVFDELENEIPAVNIVKVVGWENQ